MQATRLPGTPRPRARWWSLEVPSPPENEAVYRAVLVRRLVEGPVCVVPTRLAEPAESGGPGRGAVRRYGGVGECRSLEWCDARGGRGP